jgi:anti-anti-sigma factor
MTASLPTHPVAGSFGSVVEWHGRIAFVRMTGALDLYSAREARQLLLDLLEAEPSRLLVDVGDAFVDSCGIGILVHVAQRARQERRDFRLTCHVQLANVLRMHKLDELLGATSATPAEAARRQLAA